MNFRMNRILKCDLIQQQYHQNQIFQIIDTAHKSQEFFDNVDKIDV